MIKLLIPTKPDDSHAIYTQLALKERGHKCVLWYPEQFPINQTQTVRINQQEFSWHMQGKQLQIKNDEFNVIWNRRPQRPKLPTNLHPDDVENAQKENLTLYQQLWHFIAPQALWVNPYLSGRRANSKILQLKLASRLGLKIPKTLISNNPIEIKDFVKEMPSVIYKTLYPMVWLKSDDIRLTYTTPINSKNLAADQVLQATPGIFQERIAKAYELRITYFGSFPVAVKLLSQQHKNGENDWRSIPTAELKITPYNLPIKLHQLCKTYMQHSGLIFGCFDFIVTPEQEYYFLEMNEAGQFLWIEEINPDIRMLAIFTEFVINKNYHFSWRKSKDAIRMDQFKNTAISKLTQACQNNR